MKNTDNKERKCRVNVYLSKREAAMVKRKARNLGISATDYIMGVVRENAKLCPVSEKE